MGRGVEVGRGLWGGEVEGEGRGEEGGEWSCGFIFFFGRLLFLCFVLVCVVDFFFFTKEFFFFFFLLNRKDIKCIIFFKTQKKP